MPSIGMLGKKVGMTQIFQKNGNIIPVTILQVGPCTITNINQNTLKNIQIGYEYINPQKLAKPLIGHFQKNLIPCFKYLKEYDNLTTKQYEIGSIITVEQFKSVKSINVCGITVGKGFSGNQKRHNFKRGPMSHGSKNHRQPGSIGAGTTPGRVFPGKKMSGRMGGNQATVKNLKVMDVNISNHILIVKGSVPGKNGNLIYIYTNT